VKVLRLFILSSILLAVIIELTPSAHSLQIADSPTDTIYKKIAEKEESVLFYTIQAGSFVTLERAGKHFESVMQGLVEKELDHFRIEKIGNFYSVRLGKFIKYADAEKYVQAIKPELSQAIILEAYIKDERIVKKYNGIVSKGKKENNINGNSFEVITKHDLVMPSMPTIKNELKKFLSLSPNEKPLLFGTVISSDKMLAIIEDRATKQTGLYKINDRVMGFIVSDIREDKAILQKDDGFIDIELRGNKEIQSKKSDRTTQEYKKMRTIRTRRRSVRQMR
jgi:hypothetical protein